jgi:hypothetical protein
MRGRGLVFALAVFLVGGCGAATRPDSPSSIANTQQQDVTVHGVIHAAGPDALAVQGRTEPWFVGDDGSWFDLQLDGPFDVLADPSSLDRPVTLLGDRFVPDPAPIGSVGQTLKVTDYRFDSP